MAKVQYSKPTRFDPKFIDFIKKVRCERYKNGIETDNISVREVTRMMTNAETLPSLFKELTTKPRKKII